MKAEDRVEHACGDRYADCAIRKCEDQILADVPHRRATQHHRSCDARKIALHQSDAGALNGDLGPRSHRDADRSLSQGWSIVHPVAGHRDYPIEHRRDTHEASQDTSGDAESKPPALVHRVHSSDQYRAAAQIAVRDHKASHENILNVLLSDALRPVPS
jgi:hypothetical protein